MKKLALLLTISAGLAFGASAQTKALKFGLTGGASFSTFGFSGSESSDQKASNKTSFYVGGTLDIPISNLLSLQSALTYIGKGAKEKSSYSETEDGITFSSKIEGQIDLSYIEVPVNLIANFETGSGTFFVGAGPYYAIAVSGKVKYNGSVSYGGNTETTEIEENITFGSDEESDIKRNDFGLSFLTGYKLSNGLNIHAGYVFGLSQINNGGSETLKTTNRAIKVGLGFMF